MLKKMMERSSSEYAAQVDDASFNPEMPPPAYPKTVPTKLKLAKIISTTALIIVALVGLFILTGLYIRTISPSCDCDNMRRMNQPQYEPLIALPSEEKPVKAPLPMQLELNKDIEKMMGKNKKAHVNCVVEKKKATQLIENLPKTLMTPFGNITSDPGFMQMVGEKMIISCHTGLKKKEKGDLSVRQRREAENKCDCNCAC